jgi:hypothetical protein
MVDALRLSTLQECAPLIFGILAESLEPGSQKNPLFGFAGLVDFMLGV